MSDKVWKLRFHHDHWPACRVWGIHLTYRRLPESPGDISFRLYLGAHDLAVHLGRTKRQYQTKGVI